MPPMNTASTAAMDAVALSATLSQLGLGQLESHTKKDLVQVCLYSSLDFALSDQRRRANPCRPARSHTHPAL